MPQASCQIMLPMLASSLATSVGHMLQMLAAALSTFGGPLQLAQHFLPEHLPDDLLQTTTWE